MAGPRKALSQKQLKNALSRGVCEIFRDNATKSARKNYPSMTEEDIRHQVDILMKDPFHKKNVEAEVEEHWVALKSSIGFWNNVAVNMVAGFFSYLFVLLILIAAQSYMKKEDGSMVVKQSRQVTNLLFPDTPTSTDNHSSTPPTTISDSPAP